jgi:excisionase family DNA binding protein
MADDSFLTVAEIASELRCSPTTVKRAIASGRLRAVEVGQRTVRIPVGEYRRFIAKSRKGADAAESAAGTEDLVVAKSA